MTLDVVLITGMSGSGKSVALNALEDLGYYCVDNLPPELLPAFVRLQHARQGTRVAVAIDARSATSLPNLPQQLRRLSQWRDRGVQLHVLFLDANTATLVRRFSETRRRHPLSQAEALDYLHAIAREATGSLRLCGHSKGGNLALYAAVCCAPEIRDRIRSIDLFDAPGLDDATFSTDGYQEALPKVRSYVPQGSVIGQLMNVPQPFTVVHSRALGIAQHNVFTWQLDGPRFATLPTLDKPTLAQPTPELPPP